MAPVPYVCPVDRAILATVDGPVVVNNGNVNIGGDLSLLGNVTIGNGGLQCTQHGRVLVADMAAVRAREAREAQKAARAAEAKARAARAEAQAAAEQRRREAEQRRQAEAAAEAARLEAERLAAQQKRDEEEREARALQLQASKARLLEMDRLQDEEREQAERLRRPLQEKLAKRREKKVLILGVAGSGKSQFFNAVCHLSPEVLAPCSTTSQAPLRRFLTYPSSQCGHTLSRALSIPCPPPTLTQRKLCSRV